MSEPPYTHQHTYAEPDYEAGEEMPPSYTITDEEYSAKVEAGTATTIDHIDYLIANRGGPFSPPLSIDYLEQLRELSTPKRFTLPAGSGVDFMTIRLAPLPESEAEAWQQPD